MSLLRKLFVERLENRRLLAALAVPWPEIGQLTLSFAPDGTQVGNQTSELFRSLDPPLAVDVWQTQILRAMQTWAVESNINIGLVDDGGEPFNSLGFKQGDLRFGDVRIGAFPMGNDVLAVANPYDPFVVNTWVGDVFLNSDYKFDVAGSTGGYDLFSVMLHEAGHIFGLGHSEDPMSPMFEHFQNTQATITAADVDALRQIYGARTVDAFDALTSNDTLSTASLFPLEAEGEGEIAADVTRPNDVDLYRLEVADGSPAIELKLLARGTSLPVGRLSLLDASGQVVATAAASDPRDNDVSLSFDTLGRGGTYYVRVEAARDDVFGVGAYELECGSEAAKSDAGETSSKTTDDLFGMSAASLAHAELLATTPGYVEHTYYETEATLSNVHPEMIYRVRSVDLGPELTNVFTVIVDTYGSPNVHAAIYDDHGDVVKAIVLAETDDEIALQVSGVLSNHDYYVRVFGDHYAKDAEVEVEVDFAQDSTHWEQLIAGSLATGEAESWQTLQVNQGQAFHWSLAGSDWSLPQSTGARMTVYDPHGTAIYALTADDGTTRTGDLFLSAGVYTIRFDRVSGDLQTPLLFKLSGLTMSEGLGPQLRDTTREPIDSSNRGSSQLAAYWTPGVSSLGNPLVFIPPATGSGAVVVNGEDRSSLLASGKIDLLQIGAHVLSERTGTIFAQQAVPDDVLRPVRTPDLEHSLSPQSEQSTHDLSHSRIGELTIHSTVTVEPLRPEKGPEIAETPRDATSHTTDETGVDQFFAASLATDPVLLLASIGAVAWEMAVRKRVVTHISTRSTRLVQSLRHRVRGPMTSLDRNAP